MGVSVSPDGSIKIVAKRTPTRRAVALFLLLPTVMLVAMLGYFAVNSEIWTWPAGPLLLVLVFGVLLNPQIWFSLIFIVGFRLYWSGETLLYREGKYIVARRLIWGKGYPHRIDVDRFPSIDLKVLEYPRDAIEPGWTTSFRPRVTGTSDGSRILGVGEGLSLAEAELLAEALKELIGPKAHLLSNPGIEQTG